MTMNKFLKILPLLLFMVMTWATSTQTLQANENFSGAERFVDDIGHNILTVLRDKSFSNNQKVDRISDILKKGFALKSIGRFTIGLYWRRLSEEQQKVYLDRFEEAVVNDYKDQFQGFTHFKFAVSNGRSYQQDEGAVVVRSEVTEPGRPKPIRIDWKLYANKKGQWRVYDVFIEGASMSLSKRTEYTGQIREKGLEAFLDSLRLQDEEGSSREEKGHHTLSKTKETKKYSR